MNKIKALIEKLAASKTIKGIVMAAVGAAVNYSTGLLTPELLAQYGTYITAVSAIAQASGLSLATYGRMVAAGPIEVPSPTPPTGGGATAEAAAFDGTGAELPK